jgi:hypothetical protein
MLPVSYLHVKERWLTDETVVKAVAVMPFSEFVWIFGNC